jgi:hypothetical protein
MTRDKALARLRELKAWGDAEVAHLEADDVLLRLIDDAEITAAFEAITKWYA